MSEMIRTTATAALTICLLAAVIFVLVFVEDDLTMGIGLAAGSAVVGWLTYILLAGFAELLERSAAQEACLKMIHEKLKNCAFRQETQTVSTAVSEIEQVETRQAGTAERQLDAVNAQALEGHQLEECTACGMIQRAGRNVCWKCGVKFSRTEQG